MQNTSNWMNSLYDYHNVTESFAVGVHTVYLNFSGPEIASNHFNPNGIFSIDLYDSLNNFVTSHLDSALLSMQYNYTLFNAPSKDIQLNFKVYPNATVAVDGAFNYTHMYPENPYVQQMNATMGLSTSGNLTTETSSGTMVFLNNPYFNYSATEAHARSSYENGVESDTVNSSTILPQQVAGIYPYNTTDASLAAAYNQGLFDVAITGSTVMPSSYISSIFGSAYSTILPLNMSDVTVRADFDGTNVMGNITFHAIGGFPLADVRLDFSGNRSSLSFTGNVNVTYGNYNGYEINETTIDQALSMIGNFSGQGPGSLFNMTGGYLECTQPPSLTKIPWSDPTLGADVTFSAAVNGSFTGAIAYVVFTPGLTDDYLQNLAHAALESAASSVRNASLTLNYYHSSGIADVDIQLTSDVQGLCNSLLVSVPPAIPSPWSSYETQIEAWLNIVNATANALTSAGLNASYSSAEGKASLNAWLSANASQLKNDILSFLPDAVPSNMHDLFESFFNTTPYCTLSSSTETVDMVNGVATFGSTETLQGDFEAELNREKGFLLDVTSSLLLSTPPSNPLSWEANLLNETDININNFQAQFKVGQDSINASFSGLILKPQADNIDSVTFELKKWLNLTNNMQAPSEFDKLSVTVTGESNANQTILLSQPSDVPKPDSVSGDYRSMAWNNVSLNSLQDLMFLEAYQEQVSYGGGTHDIPIFTNSTVTSFVFDAGAKAITFNVTGPTGTLGFCNVTIPRNLLNATALSDWVIVFDGNHLTSGEFNITQNDDYVFVYLNYSHSEHEISIIGTVVPVAEFQPDILPLVLAISTLIAAIITFKQRRKLEPLKAKCRQALSMLSSKPRS